MSPDSNRPIEALLLNFGAVFVPMPHIFLIIKNEAVVDDSMTIPKKSAT